MWRTVAWGIAGFAGYLAVVVAAQMAILPLLPLSLAAVGLLVAVLPLAMLRGLWDTRVTRRHEQEADEYAVHVAGAPALLGALEALRACGVSPLMHNRWTTHGTWERRVAWIHRFESERTSSRGGLPIT